MRNKRIKRIISFVLSLCMVMAVGGIMPQMRADAAVINTNFLKTYVDLEVGQTASVFKDEVSVPSGTQFGYMIASGGDHISISSNGTITAKSIGSAVIIVTWSNGSNYGTVEIPVEVVTLKSGYYYMKTAASPCYMSIKNGDTTAGATLTSWRKGNTSIGYYQVWRVKYVGNGYYTIRCSYMPKFAVAIDSYNQITTVLNDVTTETTSSVPSSALWYISKDNSAGYTSYYRVQSAASTSKFLDGAGSVDEGGTVGTSTWIDGASSNSTMRWKFEMYADYSYADYFIPTPSTRVSIGHTTKNPIKPIVFSVECLKQDCTFTSSNTSVATVNSSGYTTGVSQGYTTITVKSVYDPDATFTYSVGVVDIGIATFLYVKNVAHTTYNAMSPWVKNYFASDTDCRTIKEHDIKTMLNDTGFWNTIHGDNEDLFVYRGFGRLKTGNTASEIDLGVSGTQSNFWDSNKMSQYINAYGPNSLNHIKVALIVASYSGFSYGSNISIAKSISNATNGSVVGFKGEISETDADTWTKRFLLNYYSPGVGTVDNACRHASTGMDSDTGVNIDNVSIK